ncbi:MAG TPA: hypothetical protein VFH61_13760 [Thermoleophilia bacterium]|nr:hypothetical protein [Thermoleophilia bacterium]
MDGGAGGASAGGHGGVPEGGAGNSAAGGYQGGSPSTGASAGTGAVPATGGVTSTGGAAGSGGSGGTAAGGAPTFGACSRVLDDQCGAEAEHWQCDGIRAGPQRPGYRCNPWAASTTGVWCCTPWDGGSVLSSCNTNAECAVCAGDDTYPLCCRYDIQTAALLTPAVCGCGLVTSCIPNVEAQ